ncbi:MAG: succinate dehydrogenase cytochrome b subunit [Desulfurivibrionaceae bacterium]|nr:succinate dehydrogenase cytochrome b subunit [Desulfobulbales bacterium]MDT8334135.1 succinate dehydrogenase cytochrome b subunit [Desulfurivibrionaceae bacterium]
MRNGVIMHWLAATLKSSIGRKSVMAGSGLLLAIFLFAHLAGNAMAFFGRATFDAYAARLHATGPLIPVFETALALVVLIHIYFGLGLFFENLAARPSRYEVVANSGGQTFASMTMPYTGLLILVFIFHHLAGFYLADSSTVSDLVRQNLSRPVTAAYYIFSLLALTLHTSHGFWSMTQTLGLSHPKYDLLIERLALAASIVIGTVFILIPVLVLFRPGFLS